MDKPWYRSLFSGSQPVVPKPVQPDDQPDVQSLGQPDRGNADVQFGLGFRFANGEGAAQDYVKAAEWYLKAAEQSHCMAQFNLGMMYAKGQGVAQNEATSVTWILKAANQGDAGAQFVLGVKHLRKSFQGMPIDVAESQIEAYKWLHLATGQGYRGSQNALNSLAYGMTHEAVSEGNHRAEVFLTGKQKKQEENDATVEI